MKSLIMPKRNPADKVINVLIWISGWVAFAAIIGIIGLTGFEIICRWIFGFSTRASEELTGYMLVAVTYLGLSYTFLKNGHLTVDVLFERLSRRWKRIFSIFNGFISVIFCFLLTFFSIKLVIQTIDYHSHSASTLNVPLIIPTLFIPIGTGVMTLAVFARTLQLIMNPSDYSLEVMADNLGEGKEEL
ncbi:MAG: hypothetical protein A2163_02515 [Actinobacteria bacterium RBG_13_35_12]|uniref:Tripartite ATP-independent periplasmic transporters DctQ component domain-containing protein n=1 Tax=Candidatus Sediminicultor quintus TaxID=1797291 RepID=A0A1F5ABU1_9BACT|nr:MAG: hypothetical protein A2163_02515 [Actinobacteria bacterium RBG_13_35_12]OGD16003.1 MAG: hypothetical protein A2V47_06805 [Candidatus Atribacteria bacterium RBG_19FT_COMBO_35_14]